MSEPQTTPRAGDDAASTMISFDPELLIRSYPGPAAIADQSGGIIFANDDAADLVAALRERPPETLVNALAEAGETRKPVHEIVTLPAGQGGATLDMTIIPIADARRDRRRLALLARNVSLDRSFRAAVVESRQRYKDLVECLSDFLWETDADGRFVFVSPQGALGYEADELVGRRADELLCADKDNPSPTPFASNQPASRVILWLRSASGEAACVRTSSIPLMDTEERWRGARGVCRDVTEERAQAAALERARHRDHALARVVRDIRRELDLDRVLAEGARATADALGASACWVFLVDDQRAAHPGARYPADAPEPPPAVRDRIAALAETGGTETGEQVDSVLLATARRGHETNAVIAVLRADPAPPWDDDDQTLLLGIANQLGAAIEQALLHERLERQSRTDSLTGLINRRAFFDEAGRRLAQALRTRRPASLLYVDVNNFKPINDSLGHARGDQALKAVAELIAKSGRVNDTVARFGGDEFVVWLDETDAAGAEARAAALAARSESLRSLSASAEAPLGLSIGIATFDPASDETLDRLLERADQAMYDAKARRSDASRFAVADPAPPSAKARP